MSDSPPTDSYVANDPETDGAETPAGAPRWAKVTVLVAGGLVTLFVLASVTGIAGDHGPGRHGGGGNDTDEPVRGGGEYQPRDQTP